MSHETTYGGRAHEHPGGILLISDFTVNLIRGVVHCQEPGLIRTTVHIRSGHRIDLRVKLPLNHAYDFLQGQQVIATIPAEAATQLDDLLWEPLPAARGEPWLLTPREGCDAEPNTLRLKRLSQYIVHHTDRAVPKLHSEKPTCFASTSQAAVQPTSGTLWWR